MERCPATIADSKAMHRCVDREHEFGAHIDEQGRRWRRGETVFAYIPTGPICGREFRCNGGWLARCYKPASHESEQCVGRPVWENGS